MSDHEEVKICPKCKGQIRKILKGPWGDRKEVEVCDCPPAPKTRGWGNE
jgi:hypothetical protein